jgi:recombination protein RecT
MNDTTKTEGAVSVLKDVPLRQVQSVKDLLISKQAGQQLAAVAARHMNPERMMRVVANAIRTTPKLQQCEPISFLGALMQCASLGLEPNTILGHAYLIPFDKTLNRNKATERTITEVQLVIGYKGLIDLARRSGHITSIHAGIHYSDDATTGGLWEYEEGTEAKLRHRNGDMAGQKKHAYAIAKFKDGGPA